MNYTKWHYQNIALAAVTQCALLVQKLAETGEADEQHLAACVRPLLILNPKSTAEIYPSIPSLSPGLRTLGEIFSNEGGAGRNEVVQYVLGILTLRSRLMGNSAMQDFIRRGLGSLSESGLQGPESARFYEQLADIYQQTISTFSFRVHVTGQAEYLKDENVANRIRALLLAGIRSAVLWYQLGGRRWRLLVYRKRIRESVAEIRRSLITTV